MLDVPDVHIKAVLPVEGIATINLGPASQSRPNLMAFGLTGIVEREIFGEERSGTHEAHLASQDVVEFGEFVEAGGAQKFSETSEAHAVRAKFTGVVSLIRHRSEFDDLERLFVEANSRLLEENRCSKEQANRNRQSENDGPEQQQGRDGDNDIDRLLEHDRSIALLGGVSIVDRKTAEVLRNGLYAAASGFQHNS